MHTKGKLTITSVEGGWDGIKCIDDNGQSTLICKMSTTNPDDIVRICCCVNSHDALLEACKAVYQDIELQNVKGGSDELNIMVQQAIAQAEKQ